MRQAVTLTIAGKEEVRLSCQIWGDADKPPVICVHGLTRNSHDFDWLAKALSEQGYYVIVPDMPGRGESDYIAPEFYTYPVYVDLCLQLLKAFECPKVRWIGTSMGGLIGMVIAAHYPSHIQRMVLNDVGPFIPGAGLQRIADYLQDMPYRFETRKAGEEAVRAIMQMNGLQDEAELAHMTRHYLKEQAGGGVRFNYDQRIAQGFASLQDDEGKFQDIDMWEVWESVSCPTLLLRGGESAVLDEPTAARMAQQPQVTLVTYPGIGHAPALMDDVQIGDITRFLSAPVELSSDVR